MEFRQDRRAFLRRARGGGGVLRPPWSVAPDHFPNLCTRCDECLTACPTHILERGDGGYPQVNFSRGECTFCGECVATCKPGALRRVEGHPPWRISVRISEACLVLNQVICRTCGEQCDARAIEFKAASRGMQMPHVTTELCTGCGACIAPCPVSAIRAVAHSPSASASGGNA